jgi:hypothetical protein
VLLLGIKNFGPVDQVDGSLFGCSSETMNSSQDGFDFHGGVGRRARVHLKVQGVSEAHSTNVLGPMWDKNVQAY